MTGVSGVNFFITHLFKWYSGLKLCMFRGVLLWTTGSCSNQWLHSAHVSSAFLTFFGLPRSWEEPDAAKMATVGSVPMRFKMSLQNPIGDITDTLSIFHTVYGLDGCAFESGWRWGLYICDITNFTKFLTHLLKAQFLKTGCVHSSVDWAFDTFTVFI